jgi:hypothetical protein
LARVKGVVALNVRDYAVATAGERAWGRVLERLLPEDREVFASMVPVGWYDMALYDRANRALAEVLAAETLATPESVMVDVGRYAAEHDLKTIHRLFLRMANPAYVLERSADFWKRFHDSGTWHVERESPTRVRARLEGWGSEDELTCVRLAAYIERLFQLVGARNGSMQRLACRARGDEACLFAARWE